MVYMLEAADDVAAAAACSASDAAAWTLSTPAPNSIAQLPGAGILR